jgi:hypothetical protein
MTGMPKSPEPMRRGVLTVPLRGPQFSVQRGSAFFASRKCADAEFCLTEGTIRMDERLHPLRHQ